MENKVYQIITDKLLQVIQSTGKLPWVKSWKTGVGHSPANGFSKRPYDPLSINFFLLSNAPYSSPYWLTVKQANELGGHIKKGEKGWPVIFWRINKYEKTNGNGEITEKTVPLLRYYTVFNVEQCEGIDIPVTNVTPYNHDAIAAAENIIREYPNGPYIVVRKSDRAYYSPGLDQVVMPELNQFSSAEAFYCTFFHELGHSTGHEKRLKRKGITDFDTFGSNQYGEEELVAELTAAFLCAEAGISNETLERNSAAYLKNWMGAIKADPMLFITAASKAGKAAKHILNIKAVAVKTEEGENVAA